MSAFTRRGNPDEDLANYIKWWQEHKDEVPRENLAKKAELFEKTCHWIPIDKWCRSELGSMKRTTKKFSNDIKDNESWKMDLEKRHYDKHHTTELISELTKSVDKMKVNLSKPKKVIKVEVIGKQAGFSLLSKNEMLRASSKK